MFTYCRKNHSVLLDLTGPDNCWYNHTFLYNISLLSQKRFVKYVSTYYISDTIPSIHYLPLDSVDSMTQIIFDEMDSDESNVLIISNNIKHIERWVQLGYSTVYLMTGGCMLYKNLKYMPDEIWRYEQFNSYVENQNFRLSYASEIIGFPQIDITQSIWIKLQSYIKVPNTNLTADFIFTGRYFTFKDNRNYNHPLSQAIFGFKKDWPNFSLAVNRILGVLINSSLESDPSISRITFVPPRPNKNSRFTSVKNYVEATDLLDYDILFSKNNYPSPKNYHTFQEKYQCVHGNIGFNKIIGGHVLLVDDVFTSGATTAECARVLYEAGASKVTILPLAFTQKLNLEQYAMPVNFNDDGNEYYLNFRNNDSNVFWYSKNNDGSYNNRNFQILNEKYLEYHGIWSTKLGWSQNYDDRNDLKAIIFDLDNTLLKTDHLEIYRHGNLNVENLNVISESDVIITATLVSELKQSGIKIGVVTRSPRNYALKLLTLYKYPFDYLVASEDTIRSKPSPDPLLKCALKLKVKPKHVLNIGDQEIDLIAGKKAGMMNLDINTIVDSNILENIIQRQGNTAN